MTGDSSIDGTLTLFDAGSVQAASSRRPRQVEGRSQRPQAPSLALSWACEACGAETPAPGLCGPCEADLQAARRDRECAEWRMDVALRIEIGDDAWAMAVDEFGLRYDSWQPDMEDRLAHVVGQASVAERGPERAGLHRVGWPESAGQRVDAYWSTWTRGTARAQGRALPHALAADGRVAPLRWQYGGMREEVPVGPISEHLVFEHHDGPWLDEHVDENDTFGLLSYGVRHYVRPVVEVPVGDCLGGATPPDNQMHADDWFYRHQPGCSDAADQSAHTMKERP